MHELMRCLRIDMPFIKGRLIDGREMCSLMAELLCLQCRCILGSLRPYNRRGRGKHQMHCAFANTVCAFANTVGTTNPACADRGLLPRMQFNVRAQVD
jgi:hypothetical protein